jgi:very-short-patch-repair endonuclease
MDEFARPGWIDVVIAELAARQQGVVARWQLRALGVGRGAIDGRILRARLHPVHRGVYALSPAPLERLARWMAAVLTVGEGGVLSHWSAASHWRLRPGTGPRSHVTVGRRRRSRPEVTLHCAKLRPDEVTEEQGIPCTTPARTLLDLAPSLPSAVLARMIEAAPPSDGAPLGELLERYAGRVGVPKLRAVLDKPTPMTRSDLEATVLEAIEAAGLPQPQVNQVVEGYEVDFVWREHSLIAELDSYVTHGSRAAFERDRERDRKLALSGWTVVRMTNNEAIEDLSRLLAATAIRSRPPRARAA